MTITDFIPYGKENAVSREYLANMTGLDDRTVRELIEKARKDVPIISLKKGYYLPLVEEERRMYSAGLSPRETEAAPFSTAWKGPLSG